MKLKIRKMTQDFSHGPCDIYLLEKLISDSALGCGNLLLNILEHFAKWDNDFHKQKLQNITLVKFGNHHPTPMLTFTVPD